MLKKVASFLIFGLIAATAIAQDSSLATITGTITDLTGLPVSSGQITFKLNAPDATTLGTTRFVSTTVFCGINASGNPVSKADGASPCTVKANLAISPAGTSYTVCIQPKFVSPGGCFNTQFLGGTSVDISTPAPTPGTLPTNDARVQGPPGCDVGAHPSCASLIQQAPTVTQTVKQPNGTTFNVNTLNGVYFPIAYSGGNLCAKIADAIADMPAAGGTIDIRGLSVSSPATCSSNPFAANNAAGSPKPVTLFLGPGIIKTRAPWLIQTDHIHIIGAGKQQTAIQYIGTTAITSPGGGDGGVVMFYSPCGPSSSGCQIHDSTIADLFLAGYDMYPTATPYGLMITQVTHGQVRNVGAWGVKKAGIIYTGLDVVTPLYDPSVTGNQAWVPNATTRPTDGIVLLGTNDNAQVTEMAIMNPIAEYVTGCGMKFGWTHGLYVVAGLIEQNGTTDICINTDTPALTTQSLIIDGTDVEVTPIGIIDKGLSNQFRNLTFQNGGKFELAGNRAMVFGGQLRVVQIDSSAVNTTFYGVNWLSVGSWTDNGKQTYIDPGSYAYNGNYQNSIYPWSSKDQTRVFVSGLQNPIINPKTRWHGVWDFNSTTPTKIDPASPIVTGSPAWYLILRGEFFDNTGTTYMNGAEIQISSSNPTYTTPGGVAIAFSLSEGRLVGTVTGSTHVAEFVGEMLFIPAAQSSTAALAFQFYDPGQLAAGTTVGGKQPWTYSGAATTGKAACVKTTSPPVIGYCSTQPDSTGSCTCN